MTTKVIVNLKICAFLSKYNVIIIPYFEHTVCLICLTLMSSSLPWLQLYNPCEGLKESPCLFLSSVLAIYVFQ